MTLQSWQSVNAPATITDEQRQRVADALKIVQSKNTSVIVVHHVWYRCSPFYRVRDATTPTFVLHGEGREDWPETSRDFALEMKRHYKTTEYKVYPNDGFYVGTLPNVRQMLSDVADFLDRYLRC